MALLGRETPRLLSEPLRPLTPHTSKGFEVIEFARQFCGVELLPWQQWWLIHALETLPGGGFRFRTVLTLVGRQNGKTHLLKVLALWMMYSGRARLVLGSAQNLAIAREAWEGAQEFIEDDAALSRELDLPASIRWRLRNQTEERRALPDRSSQRQGRSRTDRRPADP